MAQSMQRGFPRWGFSDQRYQSVMYPYSTQYIDVMLGRFCSKRGEEKGIPPARPRNKWSGLGTCSTSLEPRCISLPILNLVKPFLRSSLLGSSNHSRTTLLVYYRNDLFFKGFLAQFGPLFSPTRARQVDGQADIGDRKGGFAQSRKPSKLKRPFRVSLHFPRNVRQTQSCGLFSDANNA